MKLVPFCGGTWYNEIRKACREGNVVNEPKKIRKTAIAAVVLFTCIVIGIAWVSAGDDY